MTLNCLIVDDEPLALDLLESYVSRTPFLHLVAQRHRGRTNRSGFSRYSDARTQRA